MIVVFAVEEAALLVRFDFGDLSQDQLALSEPGASAQPHKQRKLTS
jgi:hypothetical protein